MLITIGDHYCSVFDVICCNSLLSLLTYLLLWADVWHSLTAIFHDNPDKVVPECLHCGVYWSLYCSIGAKDDRAKLQSNRHHQQTITQCFTGQMPFLSPNQQCQCTEGKNIMLHGLAHHKLTGRLFQPFGWPLKAPDYLGEGCPASCQPSDASTLTYCWERCRILDGAVRKDRLTVMLRWTDIQHVCICVCVCGVCGICRTWLSGTFLSLHSDLWGQSPDWYCPQK